ncbi:hypothetical protein Stsp02_06350 [Streptomyces sp. NBRC 14336]|nr:hypothetical protein Stsp02_06350 [Streptomyces sp. NBRC 14336]
MRGRVRGGTGVGRRLAALTGALTVTLGMWVWGAAPASAGGPTSAFLSSPATGETAGLYYSDREYTELDSLLEAGALGAPPDGAVADRGITVTWLIHDTEPWRIDRIYPVTRGEDVWVYRSMELTDQTKGSWHRASEPERLRELLVDVGVMGEPAGGEDLSAFSLREMYRSTQEDGPVAEPSAPTTPSPRPLESARAGEDTDWWWALPGGAAGAALALTARPLAGRLGLGGRKGGPGEQGPRQELLDA